MDDSNIFRAIDWTFGKMVSSMRSLFTVAGVASTSVLVASAASDPCAAIGGQKWAAPSAVRACFTSFPVNATEKANIIEVVNKTLAFHTSVNYEILAPEPFSADVHENLLADLARISGTTYKSDLDLHIDMSRTLKRLNDGHCVYINDCYDSTFISFLPTPVVLLTDSNGNQAVHIAPEAFTVASAEFSDEIQVWQDALPGKLKGQLASLSGAKVLAINGLDPFISVDANALIAGSFQPFGTRQNGFFSSYNLASTGWTYIMGQFAQQSLPLTDSVTMTIQLVNSSSPVTITLPYRSRINPATVPFTDSASFRANNCRAIDGTNGVDLMEPGATFRRRNDADGEADPGSGVGSDTAPNAMASATVHKFQQQPALSARDVAQHALNVAIDSQLAQDVVLPPGLTPPGPGLNGSSGVAEFLMLNDSKTGVLALGSFSAASFDQLQSSLLTGLQALVGEGATQLIVDVTNNGGGFICVAHWLHRIIAGPSATTVPQAGLDTKTRAGPLAQLIVKEIVRGADPDIDLLYNSGEWSFANNTPMPPNQDWLQPPIELVINGRQDAFSQRLGQECQPFAIDAPDAPLFNPKKVAIVSNGRCASSCSLFSITMAKEEGAKMVVVGGKDGIEQRYCGTVGGQSTDYSTIDTEVKTAHLKNNSLAPPDFIINGVQGITWRLAFGVDDPTQPEEWQDHPADVNLPLRAETVNNPVAIWEDVAAKVLN